MWKKITWTLFLTLIIQTLKNSNPITGYATIAKNAGFTGLSILGLAALYVIMKKI